MITENGTILFKSRLTFHSIVKARLPKNPKPGQVAKFEATVLIPTGSAEETELNQVVDAIMKEKWGDVAPNLKASLQNNKRFWGKGEESLDQKTMLPREGWTGHTYVTARNENMPGIGAPDGTILSTDNMMAVMEAAKKFYSGCYVGVEVKPYCWENQEGGRGVSAELVGIMFIQDGERMGSAPAAPTGFGAIAGAPASTAAGVTDATPGGDTGFLG